MKANRHEDAAAIELDPLLLYWKVVASHEGARGEPVSIDVASGIGSSNVNSMLPSSHQGRIDTRRSEHAPTHAPAELSGAPLFVTEAANDGVIAKSDAHSQILKLIGKQTALNPGELAHLVRDFLEKTGTNVLLWEDGKVVDGDLRCYRNTEWVQRDRVGAIVCLGDLTIAGDLILCDLEYTPFLLVAGSLRARNVVKGAQPLFVLGDMALDGYYLGIGNDGLLRVGGDLNAAGYIFRCRDFGALRGHMIAGTIKAPRFDHSEWDLPLSILRTTFVPEVLTRDGLCAIAVLARQRAGLSVWRDTTAAHAPDAQPSFIAELPEINLPYARPHVLL